MFACAIGDYGRMPAAVRDYGEPALQHRWLPCQGYGEIERFFGLFGAEDPCGFKRRGNHGVLSGKRAGV